MAAYVTTWENRCYSDGIPDDAPKKLVDSGRVPSYKHIAMAILKNDMTLKTLGFSGKESKYFRILKDNKF